MAALIGSIGTVINMHQAVFGNALGNPAYSTQLAVAQGVNGQAAIIAGYNSNLVNVNNAVLAETVLNNLFVTTANGVTQQNVDAIRLYLVSVFAIYPTAKGQIISNLTTILGGLETDGAWGGAAIAFNNAVAADYAYSNNPANLLDGNPAPATTTALTENRDTIIVSNPETVTTIDGVLGSGDRESTLVGTFTFDDLIQGVGNTQVNLSFNSGFSGGDAPYVTMSGVDQINFRATAAITAVFDASTYGSDVSVITVSGNRDATISLTNLETQGDFSLSSASNFIGDISVGNDQFDNSGRANLATPNTLAAQGNPNYTDNAMSTTLYSSIGTDANLYIDGSATGGESSVRLLAAEIEVNAGSGRLSAGDSGDSAGAHVFNYVNATDDLITAPQITVSTVDINVAKASFGEVVISNWADKTSDIGDAQALGVNVSTVTIDMEDEAEALFEVRNIASNSQEGDSDSANPAVYAGDITIGTITANGKTDADLGMKVLQLAALSTGGDEALRGGNITVGTVVATGNNPDAGDASFEVVNRAELSGPDANYTTQLGNLAMSNVTMTGWNAVNVDLRNTVDFGAVGSAESSTHAADATIGNLTAGNITLEGGGDILLNVADGNSSGRGQGAVTVGTMALGAISATSGGSGSVGISRLADSVDENATIGTTTIGSAVISSAEASSFGVGIAANAQDLGNASVGQITIGNVSVGSTQANVNISATASVYPDADENRIVTANIAGVSIGNISAQASGDDGVNDANIGIYLYSYGNGPIPTDEDTGHSGTIGNVTIGTLDVISEGGEATVSVSISSDARNADTSIGDIQIGNVNAQGQDEAGLYVAANAFFDESGNFFGGDATIGNVTVGDVTINSADNDAYVNVDLTADAQATDREVNATIASVTLGTITVNADGVDNDATVEVDIIALADGVTDAQPSTAELSDITTGAMTVTATGAEDQDAQVTISITSDVVGDGTASVSGVDLGAITINGENEAELTVNLNASVGGDGNATASDIVIGNLAVGSVTDSTDVTINVIASVDGNGNAEVSDVTLGNIDAISIEDDSTIDLNFDATVLGDGSAEVSQITIGNISFAASESASLTVELTASVVGSGNATVQDITIGNISGVAGTHTADASIRANALVGTGDALVDSVTIGNIALTATSSDASIDINVTSEVKVDEGTATVTDIAIGNLSVSATDDADVNIDIEANQFGSTIDSASNDARIDGITIGTISAISINDEADIDLEIQARTGRVTFTPSTPSATLTTDTVTTSVAGDASISNIEIGNIFAQGSTQATVSIDITAIADLTLELTGDSTISNVTIGNISALVEFGTDSSSKIDIEVDSNGDNASVSAVSIGNLILSGHSTGEDAVSVELEAIANDGNASVADITVGNVSASNAGEDGSANAGVALAAVVIDNTGEATVSNIDIGNVSASGEDLVFAGVSVIAVGEDAVVSSVVEDITIGDITSTSLNTTDSISVASLQIGAFAFATEDSVGIEASISGVDVGNFMSTGQGEVISGFNIEAELSTSNDAQFIASVENVNIGNIMAVGLGTNEVFLNAGGLIQASAFSTDPDDITNRSEAVIRNVTVGNIDLIDTSTGVGEDLLQIDFIASANGERFGDIVDLSVGNLTMTAGDNSVVNTNVQVLANVDQAGANEGDIDGLTIGNITVSVGSSGEDGVQYYFGEDDQGVTIAALDDILDVEIGNFTVSIVGDSSTLDEQTIVIDAGNVNSYISTVSLGDVDFSAIGDNNIMYGQLYVTADNTIESVSVGNVSLSANGEDSSVTFDVDVGTGEDVDNVNEVALGLVNIRATSTEGTSGADAIFNLTVFGEDEIGSITIGAPVAIGEDSVGFDLRAAGVNSDAYANVIVTNDVNELGSLDIGSISIEASGNLATAGVSIDVSVVDRLGQVSIGDISIAASSNVPQVDNEETSNSAYAYLSVDLEVTDSVGTFDGLSIGQIDISAVGSASFAYVAVNVAINGSNTGDIGIDGIDISLSNTADASTTAFATVDITHSGSGDIQIGNITVSSLVPAEYSSDVDGVGRLNSAKVVAELNLVSGDDIILGDITVVGGIYASSGVNGVTGSNSVGFFNNDIIAQSYFIDNDPGVSEDFVTVGGQQLEFDNDLRYTFVYDQVEREWNLDDVTFAGIGFSPNQFAIVDELTPNTFSVLGNLDSETGWNAAADLIATITFDGETITIDWNSEYFDDANGEIDITFTGVHGLINDDDAVTLSLEMGQVNNVELDPVDLVVLDNFYEFSSSGSWTDFSAGGGTIIIGDVDYSDYADLVNADGAPGTTDVVIDLGDMQADSYDGVSDFSGVTIRGAQGETEIIGTVGNDTVIAQAGNDLIDGGAGADQLTGGAGDDTFVYYSGSTGITLAEADTILDFATVDDVIKTDISGLVGGDVTIADGTSLADFAAFVTAANSAFNAGGDDVYVAYNASSSGNAWVAINNNGGVDFTTGDSLIVLTGINLSSEIATGNFIA
jgi:hypothetical protein